LPNSPYAATLDEAKRRFAVHTKRDPFPRIAPALLNSQDIADYVAATGMVFPFHEDAQHLKPASYEVPLGGLYVAWDENEVRQQAEIDPGEPFILKANSITFVTLEPYLQLPDYIAIRFNLRITNIYRGILLGTGPLVDPGFVGRLSVPLHNLTLNDYELMGGDGLIWMEFTKVSPINDAEHAPLPSTVKRQGKFYSFPRSGGRELNVVDYLHKAEPGGRAIRSSIPKGAAPLQGRVSRQPEESPGAAAARS
jgi:deoxycytidine triphosphate deaminase